MFDLCKAKLMKPNYALNMTHHGIDLFERAGAQWLTLGSVSLESADLDGDLAALRRAAERRSPKGVFAKLIIPASQVLYTRVHAPGPSAAQRKRQIAHALDGVTPYAVSDLKFDWSGTGAEVMVAVVAKETLAEAEDFARTYGFAAMAFVAQPEADQFAGEPWFGPTAMAAQYLNEGERVERDQDPVQVSGTVTDLADEDRAPETSIAAAIATAVPAAEPIDESPTSEPISDDAFSDTTSGEMSPPSETPDVAAAPIDIPAVAERGDVIQDAAPEGSPQEDPAPPAHDIDAPTAIVPEPFDRLADHQPDAASVDSPSIVTLDADPAIMAADAAQHPDEDTASAPETEESPHVMGTVVDQLSFDDIPSLEDAPSETATPVDESLSAAPEAESQHWLDRASFETPVAEEIAADAAEDDDAQLPSPAAPLPAPTAPIEVTDATPTQDDLTADLIAEFGIDTGTTDASVAPAIEPGVEPAVEPAAPVLARPTFAKRKQTSTVAPVASPATADEAATAQDTSATDPSLAVPPEQSLSEAARAAIPRLSPTPPRIELPRAKLPAPQIGETGERAPKDAVATAPERVAQLITQRLSGAAAKLATSGAALSKTAQSAIRLGEKFKRRDPASPVSAPRDAAKSQPLLRRDAPPMNRPAVSLAASAPAQATIAHDAFADTPDDLPAFDEADIVSHDVHHAPQEPSSIPPAPASDARDPSVEPVTQTVYDAPLGDETSDAAFAADEPSDTVYDEAPFAADVEPLPPLPSAPTPQGRGTGFAPQDARRKRNIFGFFAAKSATAAAAPATRSKYLMAKLVGALVLFMGGVLVWESYLGSDEPSGTATLPVAVVDAVPAANTQTGAPVQAVPRDTSDDADAAAVEAAAEQEARREADEMASAAPETPPAALPVSPLQEDRLTALATPPAVDGAQSPPADTAPQPAQTTTPTTAAPTPEQNAPPVIPTVSGTVTPTGTIIYAGRPSVVPPARPTSVESAAAEAAAKAAFPNADPALAGRRPRARPASVSEAAAAADDRAEVTAPAPLDTANVTTAEAQPEAVDQASGQPAGQTTTDDATAPNVAEAPETPALSDEERAEIATLLATRPKTRPTAITTAADRAAEAARAEAEAAQLAEEAARAAAEAEAQRFADATAQAVETSRRPSTKPRNFASAVDAAVAAAVASAAREAAATPAVAAPAAPVAAPVATAPVQVAAATPTRRTPSPAPAPTVMKSPSAPEESAAIDELDEPEPTQPTRGGSTTATVAGQATEKNAINLGKVNLIGLFGSKSNRRALVRMPNGSFTRVQVGDRLDGGTVTAIGDAQLSYRKGSRDVTLQLLAGG